MEPCSLRTFGARQAQAEVHSAKGKVKNGLNPDAIAWVASSRSVAL